MMTDKGLLEEEEEEAEAVSVKKGVLLKRKDFLHVDQSAQSHPNRTYYFKRIQDVDGVIDTCTKKLQVRILNCSRLIPVH